MFILPNERQSLALIPDPLERARVASDLAGRLQSDLQHVLQVRLAALREAAQSGTPRPELARQLGVSVSRVGQLLVGHRCRATGGRRAVA